MLAKLHAYLTLALLAAVIVLAAGWYAAHQVNEVNNKVAESAEVEANTRAAEVYGREAVKVYRDKEKASEQVRAITERHPDWSNEPLPDDVGDILRKPAEAK